MHRYCPSLQPHFSLDSRPIFPTHAISDKTLICIQCIVGVILLFLSATSRNSDKTLRERMHHVAQSFASAVWPPYSLFHCCYRECCAGPGCRSGRLGATDRPSRQHRSLLPRCLSTRDR